MKLTLQNLLEEGTSSLEQAGIDEARLDAEYLLLDAFHEDRTHFFIDRNKELMGEAKDAYLLSYREMIKRRTKRIPLSQITGSRWFMGLEFAVNEYVLIPRQDTETLVEAVLADYKGRMPKVLDLCTGSGCIAISLAVLGGYREVTASDISREALLVAAGNLKKSGTFGRNKKNGVTLVESDLFDAFDPENGDCFDVIVSNPPYIPTAVIAGLEPEVRDHEPRLALDGKEDGLYYYRKIAARAGAYLLPGGALYLEIGYDQAETVSGLLKDAGFTGIRIIKDTPGLDRVVTGIREVPHV